MTDPPGGWPGHDPDPALGLLVVISGPSGVGKGTVIRKLLADLPNTRLSVSVTTRPPRPGEVDGVDYLFVGDERFDELVRAGELLEWALYAGARYGTPRWWVDQQRRDGCDVLLEIEVQGALQVRDAVTGAVLVFVLPPSLAELERRLADRGTEDPAVRARRLETARWELEQRHRFDHQVVNDDVAACAAAIRSILDQARSNLDGLDET